MLKLITSVFTCIFLLASSCLAQIQINTMNSRESRIVLNTLIQEAIQNNPQIQSAEQQWRALQQRIPQASSLEDPVFSYTRWGSSVETRVGPQENVFSLSQRFPFFGKLSLRENMANQDVIAAEQRYHATVRDVIYKLKVVYYDLYRIDQSLLILKEYHQLLQDFQRVAERKYTTGTGNQANVLKAQVEISSIEERRLHFDKMREGAVARLNALLARNQDRPVAVVAVLDTTRIEMSESELIQRAVEEREELNSARAEIRKSEYGVSLAKRNYWPDFKLSFSYITIPGGKTFAPDNGQDAWSIKAGINLPLWLGRRKAAVDEAEATFISNRKNYENIQNEVEAEIKDLYARLQTAERTVNLYAQQLIPDAERTLQSVLAAYQTGTLDFLSLLDSQRMLLNFRLAYVKELANYRQQIAALKRAVGSEN